MAISYLDPANTFLSRRTVSGTAWNRCWLFYVAMFGTQPIVFNHIAAVPVQQSEQPPEASCQTTWLADYQQDMRSAVDAPTWPRLLAIAISQRSQEAKFVYLVKRSRVIA